MCDNLKLNKNLLLIDFFENAVCKHFQEVRGMHFGASKKQLSWHQKKLCRIAVKYSKEKDLIVQSFATVSKELDHEPHAIWAHMKLI